MFDAATICPDANDTPPLAAAGGAVKFTQRHAVDAAECLHLHVSMKRIRSKTFAAAKMD
jgi:hypothetical protein